MNQANDLPFSEACERNKEPVLEVLTEVLPEHGTVLEIGSCTGQHIVYFAPRLPGLTWQPSDQSGYLAGLAARLDQEGAPNIRSVLELDVTATWPDGEFDAVYSANTAHIMGWNSVRAMFAGIARVVIPGGVFCLYGPFNENGRFSAPSNERFDHQLRLQNPEMGIRDVVDLESLANRHQMMLEKRLALPANNELLVFRINNELNGN